MSALAFGVLRDHGPAVRAGAGALPLAGLPLPVPPETWERPSLNAFLELGAEAWDAVRAALPPLLAGHQLAAPDDAVLPFEVADYVDFFAARAHAENAGRILRPGTEPLTPNWEHMPVGYHGRAGTVVVSGTPVPRPLGQLAPGAFGPEPRLDVELELGWVCGPAPAGAAAPDAERHVFGAVLLADWSARTIQAWESRPLGPLLGKSFATSISAWVVPLAQLPRAPGPPQDPLPHLRAPEPRGVDLDLELALNGHALATVNARVLEWSPGQLVAHLVSNGAPLRAGDLLGSGTVSESAQRAGCLLELSWNGERPLRLPDGSTRTYLEDGDEVTLRGRGAGVELAAVRATLLRAPAAPSGGPPAS